MKVLHQRATWLAAALVASSLLASCGGGSGTSSESPNPAAKSAAAPATDAPVETYSPAGPPRPEATARQQASRAALASAPRFALPALPETTKALASAAPEVGRRQVATGRDVAGAADAASFSAQLQWKPRAGGGQQAVVLLSSEGAAGLRAGVRVEQLPDGASLRFFTPGGTEEYVVPASGGGKMVWSPYLAGAQLALEVNLPAGANPADVRIAVPRLSHFTRSPLAAREGEETPKIGEGDSCNVDASCYPSAAPELNAVARILFTGEDGGSYLCSGTLLADRTGSRTPFFLTANHCVSTQSEAATLQSFWFYRSSSCNVLALSPQAITRTGGATLLHASDATDSSFMVLNQTPPDGVAFAGWLPSLDITSQSMMGLHHPHGDLLKAAFGSFRTYKTCASSTSGILNCSNSSASTGNFFDVLLTTGTMESGSSGSGMFASNGTSGASKYLIGQLYGGSSSCTNRSGTNIYGRFDRTYQSVTTWLESGGDVVPQNGIWWNPAESGRGFAVDRQGDRVALGGYMYETNGVATWYLAVLQKRANGTYAGDLLRYAGGQTLGGAYRPPTSNTKVADAVMVFSSATTGWLKVQVPGGSTTTIQLARFSSTSAAPALSAQTGLWWNEGESGRGYLVEVQGSQALVNAYAYDASGQPTWYLANAAVQNATTASGTFQQYANGQSLMGTYRAPIVASSPGTMQITFTAADRANLTFPNGQVVPIRRFTF